MKWENIQFELKTDIPKLNNDQFYKNGNHLFSNIKMLTTKEYRQKLANFPKYLTKKSS
jgi:hypothetical protein